MSCDCPIAKLKFSFFQASYVVDYNDYSIDLRHCYPCCHVHVIAYAYFSIFVSWMQLMIDPIPRSDWGIFVRSIKTRDHRVIIWVMKQNQRSARNSPLDFLFRNQNSMNLFYGRKKKSLKCTNNSQNKRNRSLEVNFQWVSLDISKDLKNFLRLFLKLKSVPVILINDRTK